MPNNSIIGFFYHQLLMQLLLCDLKRHISAAWTENPDLYSCIYSLMMGNFPDYFIIYLWMQYCVLSTFWGRNRLTNPLSAASSFNNLLISLNILWLQSQLNLDLSRCINIQSILKKSVLSVPACPPHSIPAGMTLLCLWDKLPVSQVWKRSHAN